MEDPDLELGGGGGGGGGFVFLGEEGGRGFVCLLFFLL